jgi:hypothetical protein
MAQRPIFTPSNDPRRFFEEVLVDFRWNPGFAASQKAKNRDNLHAAARLNGLWPLLEVSSKSDAKLGIRLSAFNLKVDLCSGTKIPLESAFQGSKVFEKGGPYRDLYYVEPREAKRDPRIRNSGAIIGFNFDGLIVPSEPKTAFYDWLYIRTLAPHAEFLKKFEEFSGFTDIEFNPERSLNCQARSCAIFLTLSRRGLVHRAAESALALIDILNGKPTSKGEPPQKKKKPRTIQPDLLPFRTYHLIFNSKKWQLKLEGRSRAIKNFSTRDQAITGSLSHFSGKSVNLLIHGHNGAIEEQRTIRSWDPPCEQGSGS